MPLTAPPDTFPLNMKSTILLDTESLLLKPPPSFLSSETKLPPTTTTAFSEGKPPPPPMDPEEDLRVLSSNQQKLENCGFYYGSQSWMEASQKLKACKCGTFLLRDSEHPDFLYALSVQTTAGPTSCRIAYDGGHFKLDSVVSEMPKFPSVVDLAQFYMDQTKQSIKGSLIPVWLDRCPRMIEQRGKKDVPVQIFRPLYKEVRTLRRLCREKVLRLLQERYPAPSLSRTTLEADSEFRSLPRCVQEYLLTS